MVELVLFTSAFCPSCEPMKRKLKSISKKTGITLKVLNIDESEENFNLAMQYYVSSTPTLILFKDKTAVETIIGNVAESKILESLKEHKCA